MDPLAALSAVQPTLRPSGPASGDLATLFQEGRVLSGEVLQRGDGGSVLIGIGRHQVPAESQVRLQAGQRFMMLVQHEGGQVVLQVLAPGTAEVPRLLTAMRALSGGTFGMGSLLGRLLESLRSPTAELERAGSADLAQRLGSHVFRPGVGGDALALLLRKSGLFYEGMLARVLASRSSSAMPGDGAGSMGDLKGVLLRALAGFPPGPVREAIEAMLAGVEMEQLTNLARRQGGEGFHWSLPVPDGAGWATVDLVLDRASDDAAEDEEGAGTGVRLTVGVSFSALGPVRADLLMVGDTLTARVLASRGSTLAKLVSHRDDIVGALGVSGLTVRLSIVPGKDEEVSMHSAVFDVSLLREHHLIDVRG